MNEKILSSKRIYSGRIVTLDLNEVELPDGQHQMREIIVHPGATALIALDNQNRILLVRQFRSAAAVVMSEIPAGVLNAGEDPMEAAVRELQEETGYKPGKIERLGGFYTAPGYTTEYIHLYIARELAESRLPADEDEFIEVERVSLENAMNMIEQGKITDAKTIIALLMYARHQPAI
ncbi:MAG: NUDIX domain-containing protein [Anaerolineaceae bacterium]|nr:NUDIX domain-containing protein [Anaerolineaceae bacterium]